MSDSVFYFYFLEILACLQKKHFKTTTKTQLKKRFFTSPILLYFVVGCSFGAYVYYF